MQEINYDHWGDYFQIDMFQNELRVEYGSRAIAVYHGEVVRIAPVARLLEKMFASEPNVKIGTVDELVKEAHIFFEKGKVPRAVIRT